MILRSLRNLPTYVRVILILFGVLSLSACASLVDRAGQRFADQLARALENQADPGLARDGLPAYLLLIDAMIEGSPEDRGLLLAGSRLYGTYAGSFVVEPERRQRLSWRALELVERAICKDFVALCDARQGPFADFESAVAETPATASDLYALGAAWAGHIEANSSDWDRIADVPRVRLLLERAVALQPDLDRGQPHLYLGVLESLLPPAVGGRPELARSHLERALSLSDGKNLMAKTLLAERYARMMFERELHDQWIGEVLASDGLQDERGWRLSNELARERARQLQASADDYF